MIKLPLKNLTIQLNWLILLNLLKEHPIDCDLECNKTGWQGELVQFIVELLILNKLNANLSAMSKALKLLPIWTEK